MIEDKDESEIETGTSTEDLKKELELDKSFDCADCEKSFESQVNLEGHAKAVHQVTKSKPKQPFLKSRKGKFVLGITLLLACFWTAYALDYVINPTPATEDFHVMLTEHCWTDYQVKLEDDKMVYMGLECYNTITDIDEVSVALGKMTLLAKEKDAEITFSPGQSSTLFKKFIEYGSEPGDNT